MVKRILKGILVTILILIIGFVGLVYARKDRTFMAPYPEIKASTDSAVIARGRAIVYGPAHCANCHAPTAEFYRVDKGEEIALSGGFNFEIPIGTIYAPNITNDVETGIGKRTDGELARTLRYGVRHDGKAVLDFMPFYDMSDEDITAVISFLRSQPAIKNPRPQHEFNFIGKAVMAFLVKPSGDGDFPPTPPADSTVDYGRYLSASVANCRGCHTNRDMMTGAYIGADYAGGAKFEVLNEKFEIVRGKHFITPNLSTDPQTGRIAGWTQKDFIERFRKGRLIPGSPMPWGPFSRMTDIELIAIYKFLQTVPAANNLTPLGIQEGDPN
jgi:mono/diheme cytochrome c family protein